MKTGIVFHELYLWHDTGNHADYVPYGFPVEPFQHSENPDAKRRIKNLMEVSGLYEKLFQITPRKATKDEILLFHTEDHFEYIKSLNEGYWSHHDYEKWTKENGKPKYPKWVKTTLKEIVKGGFMESHYDAEHNYMVLWLASLETKRRSELYAYDNKGKKEFGKVGYALYQRFYNDLTSYNMFFMQGAMYALEVSKHIRDMEANGEPIEPAYYLMKEYFNNMGMDTKRSRVFNAAYEKLEKWTENSKHLTNLTKEKATVERALEQADNNVNKLGKDLDDLETAKCYACGQDLHDDKLEEMKDKLAKKYGQPEEYDFLLTGSIWNEPNDWMNGIINGERSLIASWESSSNQTLPNHYPRPLVCLACLHQKPRHHPFL